MKDLIAIALAATVMAVSHPSFAYGDILFHGLLKETMEREEMPKVAPPITTELPCTGSRTVVIDDLDGKAPEELLAELNRADGSCRQDAVRRLHAKAPPPLPPGNTTNCTMYHPMRFGASFGPGLGSVTGVSDSIPKDYVPYGTGYTHKDCVPR